MWNEYSYRTHDYLEDIFRYFGSCPKENGEQRYQSFVIGRDKSNSINSNSKSNNEYKYDKC
jgi:hypothetical protein